PCNRSGPLRMPIYIGLANNILYDICNDILRYSRGLYMAFLVHAALVSCANGWMDSVALQHRAPTGNPQHVSLGKKFEINWFLIERDVKSHDSSLN
ncbi:hypothetical protein ACJX0J_018433, partial [Zea mays]